MKRFFVILSLVTVVSCCGFAQTKVLPDAPLAPIHTNKQITEKYIGYEPEPWFLFYTNKLSELSYCRYLRVLAMTNTSNTYGYCWSQVKIKVSPYFSVGGAVESIDRGMNLKFEEISFGPSVGISIKGMKFSFISLNGRNGFHPQGEIIYPFSFKRARR